MRGSYFYILRKTKYNKVYSTSAFNKIVEEKRWLYDDFKPEKLSLNDIQNYQILNDFKCISIQNKTEYDILLDAHFTSGFNCLIEEFNMNAYNKFGEKTIPLYMAKEMAQAVNYILSLNYSKQIELILNNPYLDVFETLYYPFTCRFIHSDSKDAESNEFDKEGLYFLKKIKNVLDTFILLNDENSFNEEVEYVLVYKNY